MNTTPKLITKPTELLLFLKHLTSGFDTMTKDEYINLMRDFLGVYEYDKPKDVQTALQSIKTFVDNGFAYLPLDQRPLFFDFID
jgi:hypothetical protein